MAERFNKRYGETFVMPDVYVAPVASKVLNLQNQLEKMNKSDSGDNKGTIFLMYDITSIETFTESMRLYEKEVKLHFEQLNMNIPLVYFIGNKIDLRERKVSSELSKEFCEKNNLINFELSVKTGSNVRILLKDLLDKCVVFNAGEEE